MKGAFSRAFSSNGLKIVVFWKSWDVLGSSLDATKIPDFGPAPKFQTLRSPRELRFLKKFVIDFLRFLLSKELRRARSMKQDSKNLKKIHFAVT